MGEIREKKNEAIMMKKNGHEIIIAKVFAPEFSIMLGPKRLGEWQCYEEEIPVKRVYVPTFQHNRSRPDNWSVSSEPPFHKL